MKANLLRSKLALVGVVAMALFIVWNAPTLINLSKPLVLRGTLGQAEAEAPKYDASASHFYYPTLGIDATVTESPETSPMKTQDWSKIRTALTQGVSLNYSASSLSDSRLSYLTGHSSDTYPHAYSAVFAGLTQAGIGDEFVITGNGAILKYEVVKKQTVDPSNTLGFSESTLVGTESGHYVALVTCWPVFTTAKRLVVVGRLK